MAVGNARRFYIFFSLSKLFLICGRKRKKEKKRRRRRRRRKKRRKRRRVVQILPVPVLDWRPLGRQITSDRSTHLISEARKRKTNDVRQSPSFAHLALRHRRRERGHNDLLHRLARPAAADRRGGAGGDNRSSRRAGGRGLGRGARNSRLHVL